MKLFRLIIIGGAMAILAGCSGNTREDALPVNSTLKNESPSQQEMTNDASDSDTNNLKQSIALSFKDIEAPRKPLSLRDSKADKYTSMKKMKLNNGEIEIFRKASDEEQVFAALHIGSKVYEIGEIGNTVSAVDLYEASDTAAFSEDYMKVTGGIGANTPIAYYIGLDESTPFLLVRIDGHTLEADANKDGSLEIISTVGTAADTTIYHQTGDRIEAANVNEALGAQIVLYDSSVNLFKAYAEGAGETFTQWKMTANTLHLLPQKTMNPQ